MPEMIVRYKGAADTRIMSMEDLKAHDVDVPEDLVFSRANLWRIRMDVDDRLEAIFRMDGAFRLEVMTDEGRAGETLVDGTRTDDTADTVVDGNTGQVSTKESSNDE